MISRIESKLNCRIQRLVNVTPSPLGEWPLVVSTQGTMFFIIFINDINDGRVQPQPVCRYTTQKHLLMDQIFVLPSKLKKLRVPQRERQRLVPKNNSKHQRMLLAEKQLSIKDLGGHKA